MNYGCGSDKVLTQAESANYKKNFSYNGCIEEYQV